MMKNKRLTIMDKERKNFLYLTVMSRICLLILAVSQIFEHNASIYYPITTVFCIVSIILALYTIKVGLTHWRTLIHYAAPKSVIPYDLALACTGIFIGYISHTDVSFWWTLLIVDAISAKFVYNDRQTV